MTSMTSNTQTSNTTNTAHNVLTSTNFAGNDRFNIVFHSDSMSARSNYRLVVIRFKESKNSDGTKKKAPAARSVEIPDTRISCNPAVLSDAMTAAFHELQESIIRQHIEQLQDGSIAPDQTFIIYSQISEEGVADWFIRNASSGKLSKEAISLWFDNNLHDTLGLAVVNAKPGIKEQDLHATLDAYKRHITSLASPRANINIKLAEQLRKAILMAEQDKVRDTLNSKLELFLKPQEQVSLLDL